MVGAVQGGPSSVGLAVVVLGSQMTHGAAQVEAVQAARWAAEALGAHPLGLFRERMGPIPSVALEWLGKVGMWWMRSELGSLQWGGSAPAPEPTSPPQGAEERVEAGSAFPTTGQEPAGSGPLLPFWMGLSPLTLLFILCMVLWIVRKCVNQFCRSTSLVTVNIHASPAGTWVTRSSGCPTTECGALCRATRRFHLRG